MHIVSNVRGRARPGARLLRRLPRHLSRRDVVGSAEDPRHARSSRSSSPSGAASTAARSATSVSTAAMDTCIAIRTMLIKDGTVYVQAGAGIVADSDPEREHAECLNKARGLLAGPETRRAARWGDAMTRPAQILMIDNYDSFTYNLVQYLGELGADVEVRRNDAITLDEVAAREPDGIVISPGPCTPKEAGVSVRADRALRGHDSDPRRLSRPSGDRARRSAARSCARRASCTARPRPFITTAAACFAASAIPFDATRYHSLVIERATPAGGARGLGVDGRGRDHGRAPSPAARSRACSSIRSRS